MGFGNLWTTLITDRASQVATDFPEDIERLPCL